MITASQVIRKALPTLGMVHISRPLVNMTLGFMNAIEDFVADKVFPIIPVEHITDSYFVYPKGYTLRRNAAIRTMGGETVGLGYKLETASYSCDVWGVHCDVPWQLRANADPALDLDSDAAQMVAHDLLLTKEIQFAATAMVTSVWTKNIQGVASGESLGTTFRKWSDDANSNPIADMLYYQDEMKGREGVRPKFAVMTSDVVSVLLNHADIIDRLKYGQTPGQPAMANLDSLAKLFNLSAIYVMDAVYNSAAEGATDAIARVATKKVLLFHKPAKPGKMVQSAGYTFSWRQYPGGADNGTKVSKYPIQEKAVDRIEGEQAYDHCIVAAGLGTLLYDVIA